MLPIELLQTLQLSEQNKALLTYLQKAEFDKIILTSQTAGQIWQDVLESEVVSLLKDSSDEHELLLLGLASLYAFLQANVTGPPLSWSLSEILLKTRLTKETRRAIITFLSLDGQSAYHLAPQIELFCLAKTILCSDRLTSQDPLFSWARLSVNYWHQQLLNEVSPSLQATIEQDLMYLDSAILGSSSKYSHRTRVLYLLEKASINMLHDQHKKAREDLKQATELQGFQYILTGRLGRRTKFQEFDVSQLVVLAKSADSKANGKTNGSQANLGIKPENLELDDDTLLDKIAFTKDAENGVTEDIPPALAELDAANQPVLDALDSIILLSVASSITNTLPDQGETREETLPYATRVIDGGSTNWQLYTQALLVRSRIEGYRSRTIERSMLQLQAVVDQVIAETTASTSGVSTAIRTFLPRAEPSETASPVERLMYLDQLGAPFRWSLEAELAARWLNAGGLKTALEIYERLEMWAEAALCLAATDQENEARKMLRRQLYAPTQPKAVQGGDEEKHIGEELRVLPAHALDMLPADESGVSTATKQIVSAGDEANGVTADQLTTLPAMELSVLPTDAPRLFCILGDIEEDPKHYERAWEVSNYRFARAQRSLGKHYAAKAELQKAVEAYSKSLAIDPHNAGAWFSLGCIRLQTQEWQGAVNAFSRMVQLKQDDAEGWNNLGAAIRRLPPEQDLLDADGDIVKKADPEKHTKEAFLAFKRAASLKYDSYRLWRNVLHTAILITPPPYTDLITAQQRIIELRKDTEGEECVDVEVMEGLLSHVIANQADGIAKTKYGMENMFLQLIWKQVYPLITHSRRLWQLVAKVAIFENKPSTALEKYENAWRATLNTPGWDDGFGSTSVASTGQVGLTPEEAWVEVVSSTLELVDAYESLGEKEVTEGLAAGTGAVVCKDWKFKARSALRSVMGRRVKAGYDDVGVLKERLEELKA